MSSPLAAGTIDRMQSAASFLQYADVFHLRNGEDHPHWHLAVDPKADAEAAAELFAS